MVREVDVRVYQPRLVKDTDEFKALAVTENPELTLCWEGLEAAEADQFVDTLTANGCKRWEKILNIQPKATDTLEERRFRIKTRLNENLPYTYRRLTQLLDALCGAGNYEATVFHNEYRLKVLLELIVKKTFDEAQELLERIIPANLILEVAIRYNQWQTVLPYTWAELKTLTWKTVKEDMLPAYGKYASLLGKTQEALSAYTHGEIEEGGVS